jgi:hypothetical protein
MREPHLAIETQNEGMTGSALCCVDVELLGLAGGLRASPGDDEDVLETICIKKRGPRQMDDAFMLITRKVLRLSVRSLDGDPGNRSLEETAAAIIQLETPS